MRGGPLVAVIPIALVGPVLLAGASRFTDRAALTQTLMPASNAHRRPSRRVARDFHTKHVHRKLRN
jgi:hypothetical protein